MIKTLDQMLEIPPFSLAASEKADRLSAYLTALTRHHRENCEPYARILTGLGYQLSHALRVEDLPFLPVRMFKDHTLRSVPSDDIQKTMTSSGTSGQRVSQIFLDRETATYQTKVLSKLVQDMIGPKRLPMLIIDAPGTVKNRQNFSARGAGILGFSMFGRNVTYALRDDMTLNLPEIDRFLERFGGSPIFLFGFTSIVFQHFIEALEATDQKLTVEKGILLHGGGWKKLASRYITNDAFKERLLRVSGIGRIINYYGMVEQTGSIFTECEHGHLHASIFSDILIRSPQFESLGQGKRGLVQLISVLPKSYPGHSLLSEDVGEILGEDDCPCGRLGKYFKIYGRAEEAEIRGCSDTYAA